MTESEYRNAEGINKSTLWEMRRSPAHYLYSLDHQTVDTAALRFGRALHAAVLTPALYQRDFVVAPDVDKRTKAGREEYAAWRASLPDGAEEITVEDANTIDSMVQTINQDNAAMRLLAETVREYPIFWTDRRTGLKCKCRVDAMGASAIVDLKTTTDVLTFDRDANLYGYHVQAAHYLRGAEAETGKFLDWYFIVIEKKPPYGLKIIKATAGFIDYGDYVRAELMDRVRECQDAGEWPSYAAGEIAEPHWVTMGADV